MWGGERGGLVHPLVSTCICMLPFPIISASSRYAADVDGCCEAEGEGGRGANHCCSSHPREDGVFPLHTEPTPAGGLLYSVTVCK